jgi:hypothetical protein
VLLGNPARLATAQQSSGVSSRIVGTHVCGGHGKAAQTCGKNKHNDGQGDRYFSGHRAAVVCR